MKKCEYCGKKFEAIVPWKRFCNSSCKLAAWAIVNAKRVNKTALKEAQKAIK